MIPYPWEFPEKNMEKNFLMGISMRFTILWEIPLSTFSYGKSHFLPPPLMGNPHPIFSLWKIPTQYFPYGKSPLFLLTPYGKSPKKIWKENFLRDIWTTVPPKMGVPPGERGYGGIPTPPIYPIGGGNYLFGNLFGCYLFSVLLILFILAVSDAILSFIFVTFLLWRYLL